MDLLNLFVDYAPIPLGVLGFIFCVFMLFECLYRRSFYDWLIAAFAIIGATSCLLFVFVCATLKGFV